MLPCLCVSVGVYVACTGMACKVVDVLQGVVKRFFNEKEVTSTLVMDALFSGCKQLEEASRQLESKKVQILGLFSSIINEEQLSQRMCGHSCHHIVVIIADVLSL